jgi:hypothetical protein
MPLTSTITGEANPNTAESMVQNRAPCPSQTTRRIPPPGKGPHPAPGSRREEGGVRRIFGKTGKRREERREGRGALAWRGTRSLHPRTVSLTHTCAFRLLLLLHGRDNF